MSTLRARQKEDRRNRIVSSAKRLFEKKGYDRTTIENIAESAGVSGVTVHNYYGTKAGVLLALVIENDQKLITRLEDELPAIADDLISLTMAFARIILDHAINNLDKVIWRQVIAAVTIDPDTQLSKSYSKLDTQLAYVLVRRIEALQTAEKLPASIDPAHLGNALFHLQNALFIQFISRDNYSQEEIETRLRNDLLALFAVPSMDSNS